MNCTVESLAHVWVFGSLEVIFTPGTSQDVVTMGFTFRLVEIGDTAIASVCSSRNSHS